ncbi:YheV family putative zinc ribbon protein [Kangiella marina]|uniref:DNA-binding protein n=1 Tax=Kangiella marina TaxID=1079178 RepID=A0ABP8IJT6_9GAMM
MNHKTTPKRFVAGARCPECKAMDTIVCFYQDDVFIRECVECDFVERITDDETVEAEPKSSVTPAQVIKIKEL